MSEIYSFENGCINSYLSFKNTGNKTAVFEVIFSIISNSGINAVTEGFNYNCFSMKNIGDSSRIIPSTSMYIQTGNLTVSWYGEESIYHGGIISRSNNGNRISIPFGPISLSPDSSYSLDPAISPSPMRIIGTPPGGGCCIKELPSISNFHNLTSPYLGPGEYYSFKGYVNINGKIDGAYPSTYVGYAEKYINSKYWSYYGMKTIRSNQCVELNVPYRDLINARCIRMIAFNLFGIKEDQKKVHVYTALISPVNRTIEIYNSTGFAVGAYNMALGPFGPGKIPDNYTYPNNLPTCASIGNQEFETTVSYLNSSISPNYFFMSPNSLSESVCAETNISQNYNPLLIDGYSLCAGSQKYSNGEVNSLKELIESGFDTLLTSLSAALPEYAILYSIISSIIQYVESNYFYPSDRYTSAENYGNYISASYSYNIVYSNCAQRERHFWGISTGPDYIEDIPNNCEYYNFTTYLMYSVSMTLPGFINEPTDCGHSEYIPFSISLSYTLMGYYRVSFHE
ncbi:MAG: hypothetical protein M1375_04015 [Candidatus Thermoplasmatota archaeon]|nr:hypothetical protein [Candidatus Thermoplasmatota archaeon]MCL5791120.1 hypothetical protein [Candidatus Thermoplasmatota archaeon]